MTWLKLAEELPEDAPVTDFDIEMTLYNRLVEILIQKGVDYRKINQMVMSYPTETRKDLALLNATLMNLGADSGIPRNWLVERLEQAERRFERDGTARDKMWLKTGLDGVHQGPELKRNLPTATQPNLKGPAEKEMPLGPGLAPMGPVGPGGPGMGAPKPPMPSAAKPPMPGGAPMGGPGGAPGAGGSASEVKMLLDKGDLEQALSVLQKLVGDKKPAAPGMGAPAPKPSFPPKKEGPAAGLEKKDEPKKDEKPAEKKPEEKKEGSLWRCGSCHDPLELACGACNGPLVCTGCSKEAKFKGPDCAKCEKSECACKE